MKSQFEVLMGGSGGQGLVFLASFLAEAAICDGKNVVQTQSYGIAQRGGYISTEVLIDNGEILYQQVQEPSVILALHPCVGDRYDKSAAPVLYDSSLMEGRLSDQWYGIPFVRIAEELSAPRASNLVALGSLIQLVPVVRPESLFVVASRRFPPEQAERNISAIKCGMQVIEKIMQELIKNGKNEKAV